MVSWATYTLRQSVIVRPMHPSPATSTTFSCQLSSTLMAAPEDSFAAPGRPPAWLKPVACGVILPGVRGPAPAPDVDAMPLYLIENKKVPVSPTGFTRGIGRYIEVVMTERVLPTGTS